MPLQAIAPLCGNGQCIDQTGKQRRLANLNRKCFESGSAQCFDGKRQDLRVRLRPVGGADGREVFAGRSREEIVDRLMEQAAESASLRLDRSALSAIEAVLAISGPAEKSLADLAAVLKTHRIALDAPLEAIAARIGDLRKLRLSGEQVSFAPRFGRNLDYYTGFVFELWARDADGPVQVAGGGRYDTLLKTLGSSSDIPAVGCAIRDERVLAAREFLKGAR